MVSVGCDSNRELEQFLLNVSWGDYMQSMNICWVSLICHLD